MSEGEVLEGFLCPVCHQDCSSVTRLLAHFEEYHATDDHVVVQSFKGELLRASSFLINDGTGISPLLPFLWTSNALNRFLGLFPPSSFSLIAFWGSLHYLYHILHVSVYFSVHISLQKHINFPPFILVFWFSTNFNYHDCIMYVSYAVSAFCCFITSNYFLSLSLSLIFYSLY